MIKIYNVGPSFGASILYNRCKVKEKIYSYDSVTSFFISIITNIKPNDA